MTVKYVGPHDAVEVAGLVVERGKSADLGDLEPSLLEQVDNWQPVTAKTAAAETKEA